MHGSAFNSLLTGTLSSRVVWEKARICPCVGSDGSLDRTCGVCGGKGKYWDLPSDEFRAGVLSLSAKALAAIQQRFGPGLIGDAQISIPGNAEAWSDVGESDRFTVLDALDSLEWIVTPGNPVALPYGAEVLRAKVRTVDKTAVELVDVPEPNGKGKIAVSVATVLSFRAPRRFEVVRDLSQVRAFGDRLPKKLLLKLIDWTVR